MNELINCLIGNHGMVKFRFLDNINAENPFNLGLYGGYDEIVGVLSKCNSKVKD